MFVFIRVDSERENFLYFFLLKMYNLKSVIVSQIKLNYLNYWNVYVVNCVT